MGRRLLHPTAELPNKIPPPPSVLSTSLKELLCGSHNRLAKEVDNLEVIAVPVVFELLPGMLLRDR